jgi:sulfide dehydrogenase cytochrome subunit
MRWRRAADVGCHYKFNGGHNKIMPKRYSEFTLIACAALFGLFLTSNACAENVNKLVKICADCHGKNGASIEPEVPIIGGYSVEFLVNNLKAYKTQDRACPETEYRTGSKKGTKTDMCKMVKDLNDSDIQKVAQYFSKQKFVRAKQKFDSALAAKGKEIHDIYCEKCHSQGGTVADDEAGLPAGQWMPYLKQAIDEFNTGKRPISKKMKLKMDELEQADFDALINYYASFN